MPGFQSNPFVLQGSAKGEKSKMTFMPYLKKRPLNQITMHVLLQKIPSFWLNRKLLAP